MDWEMRKALLIRSLFFDDFPSSSRLPEEGSSISPSSRPTSLSIILEETREQEEEEEERVCSPLPPLIIEREPNKHDEPEEFYEELEKKVLKFYKRVFIEERSDQSDISDISTPDSIYIQHLQKRASFGEANHTFQSTQEEDEIIEQCTNDNEMSNNDDLTPQHDKTKNIAVSDEKELLDTNKSLKNNHARESKSRESDKETYETDEERMSTASLSKNTCEDEISSEIEKEISPKMSTKESSNVEDRSMSIIEKENASPEIIAKSTTDEEIVEEPDSSFSDTEASSHDKRKSKSSLNISNESVICYREITFKADVHRDATDFEEAPRMVHEQNVSIENVENDDFEEDRHGFVELEESGVSDTNNQKDSTQESEILEVEIMRTPRVDQPSAGSVQNEPMEADHNDVISPENRKVSLEDQTESDSSKDLEPHPENFEESIDFDFLRTTTNMETSTPKAVTKSTRNITGASIKRTNSSSPSSSSKRVRQATLGDEDGDRQNILNDNLFVGIPRVYRLCSCANHRCSS